MTEHDRFIAKKIKREYNCKVRVEALEKRNKNLVAENKKLVNVIAMQKAQLNKALLLDRTSEITR